MVIEYEVKPYGLITKISLMEPTSNKKIYSAVEQKLFQDNKGSVLSFPLCFLQGFNYKNYLSLFLDPPQGKAGYVHEKIKSSRLVYHCFPRKSHLFYQGLYC